MAGNASYIGHWGPVTATVDWCELNYVISPYLAEFWNATTNFFHIALSIISLIYCARSNGGKRLWMVNLMGLMVAVGSFIGHGTLLFELQLLDELPMLYWAAACAYCTIEDKKERSFGIWIPLLLTTYVGACSLACIFLPDPGFHRQAFGILIATFVLRSLPTLFGNKTADEARTRRIMYVAGVGSFALAFALWNMDNHFCDHLHEIRDSVGMFAPVFQLHAWWHILTGVALHVTTMYATYHRFTVLGKSPKFHMVGGVLPVVLTHDTCAQKRD
jgi:dihydroceramidase